MGNKTSSKKKNTHHFFTKSKLHESLTNKEFLDLIKPYQDPHGLKVEYEFVEDNCFVDDIDEKFEMIRKLGYGASGQVWLAKCRETEKLVALKRLAWAEEANQLRFRNEVSLLCELAHPTVLKFHKAYVDNKYLYISSEYCAGGRLLDQIRKEKQYSEEKASKILRSIVSTIKHCHDHDVVHRDIKPLNLLYDREENGRLVLIDFGDAVRVEDEKLYSDIFGTLLFAPPEFARRRTGWELKQGDMWAVGVIGYLLLFGQMPYGGTRKEVLEEIMNFEKVTFPREPRVTLKAKYFLWGLLRPDPNDRLTAEAALEHPFLTQNQSEEHLGMQLLDDISDFYDANVLKRYLVHNLTAEMSLEEKLVVMKTFREIDRDNDGYLVKNDIVLWLVQRGTGLEEARERAESIVSSLDGNRDSLSVHDFMQMQTFSKFNSRDSITQAARELACPGDKIPVKKLEKRLSAMYQFDELQQGLDIVSQLEADERGCVDLEEFIQAVNVPQSELEFQRRMASSRARRISQIALDMPSFSLDEDFLRQCVQKVHGSPKSTLDNEGTPPVCRRFATDPGYKRMSTTPRF